MQANSKPLFKIVTSRKACFAWHVSGSQLHFTNYKSDLRRQLIKGIQKSLKQVSECRRPSSLTWWKLLRHSFWRKAAPFGPLLLRKGQLSSSWNDINFKWSISRRRNLAIKGNIRCCTLHARENSINPSFNPTRMRQNSWRIVHIFVNQSETCNIIRVFP